MMNQNPFEIQAGTNKEDQTATIQGRLFSIYGEQIEKYQQDTRARAAWSFGLAIISMFLGMAFIFWGGSIILTAPGIDSVAAGSAVSGIGGGISAYITKTFLDVHKLSITQLNRYYQQPVISDNILKAQRLADDIGDDDVRKQAYQRIIEKVIDLMSSDGN